MTEILTVDEYQNLQFRTEFELQAAICQYIRANYPDVIFQSDLSGIKLNMGQAVKVRKIKYGKFYPDLFIAKANLGYCGFFGEIKLSEDDYLTQKGELRQIEHIQGQSRVLQKLRKEGFWANFLPGYSAAINNINWYLTGIAEG